MAEINVQRKERNIWGWIIGGVALLILLIIVFSPGRAPRTVVPGVIDTVEAPRVTTPVTPMPGATATEQFRDFAREAPDFGDMNLAHSYTRNGLRYLAEALDEIAQRHDRAAPVRAEVAALRQSAEQLGRDPAGDHARIASRVFVQASDAITRLQRTTFPRLAAEAQAVEQSARAIRADVPLLEQRDQVREFFARASATVERMGAEPAATAQPSP